MRCIDADALINELNNSHYPGAPYIDAGISIAIGKVCDAPTIEPERKTGKWIHHKPFDCEHHNCNTCIECSCCGTWFGADSYAQTNYCPNCGAEMEEGGQE